MLNNIDNLRHQKPFAVSQDYFDNFDNRLNARISKQNFRKKALLFFVVAASFLLILSIAAPFFISNSTQIKAEKQDAYQYLYISENDIFSLYEDDNYTIQSDEIYEYLSKQTLSVDMITSSFSVN